MKKTFLFSILTSFLVLGSRCNQIPENTDYFSNFAPHLDHYWKSDSGYIFNPTSGYEVNFTGSCTRTTQKPDAQPISTDRPAYMRFSTQRNVVPEFNGQAFGCFDFVKGDIKIWSELLNDMKYGFYPLGLLIKEYMDPAIYDTLIGHETPQTFSSSDSMSIISTIKAICINDSMYQKHNALIKEYIHEEKNMALLRREVEKLIEQNIFLDTNGTLSGSLNNLERETLHWFNRMVFARFASEQVNRSITKYPANYNIFTLKIEQGVQGTSSPDFPKQEVTCYFSVSSLFMRQLAFIEEGNAFLIYDLTNPNSKICDYYFNTRKTYPVALLIFPSDIPFVNAQEFSEVIDPGKMVLSLLRYSHAGDTLYYNMKLYYSIIGTIYRNDKPYDIYGTITILSHFYKLPLFNPGYDQGHFQDWTKVIDIRKIDEHGKEEKFTEKQEFIATSQGTTFY